VSDVLSRISNKNSWPNSLQPYNIVIAENLNPQDIQYPEVKHVQYRILYANPNISSDRPMRKLSMVSYIE
jgi:hypothetical protein